jgi:two-component system chemotaxis sensor kinase CheA
MSDLDIEVLREFLLESHENLDRLDQEFVALETNPGDRARIATILRAMHTIKGTSGFFGLTKLGKLTHAGESLLVRLRDGKQAWSPAVVSVLLRLVDVVRAILKVVEKDGTEGAEDHAALVAELERMMSSSGDGADAGSVETQKAAPRADAGGGKKRKRKRAAAKRSEALSARPSGSIAPPSRLPSDAPRGRTSESPRAGTLAPDSAKALAVSAEEPAGGATIKERGGPVADSTVRIDVAVLDNLMNLVGELVLARNRMLQFSVTATDTDFLATVQRLTSLTTELQEGVMKTRMQPISSVWSKLPRVVRDLASECGKQVKLEMEGQDTELDRTLIDAIRDPFVHMVRNAIDHGIELPEVRARAGKLPVGTLKCRAFHEAGQVVIDISDDGGGIDPDRVLRKALQTGLITSEQARHMSDREAIQLIFAEGLSTAAQITNISGRGVGMDVVKTNVEKIGGSIEIQSKLGQGTTLRIRLPLTLAIIPALVVTSAGERFAIPQPALLELVHIDAESGSNSIETLAGVPIFRLRGELVPIVYLNDVFELSGEARPSTAPSELNIVVLQAERRRFGLVVDAINDTQEIVVKPLGSTLTKLPYFAGATIMGDGRVALILDVSGIARRANVAGDAVERSIKELGKTTAMPTIVESVLLFGLRGGARMGMPLALVARLEEVKRSSIENTRRGPVIQYRGQIMPLIDVASVIPGENMGACCDATAELQVIVFADGGNSYGLIVDRILDIAHESVGVVTPSPGQNLLGTAVIQGEVTDMLDAKSVIAKVTASNPSQLTAA